jgi:hypothetical protein
MAFANPETSLAEHDLVANLPVDASDKRSFLKRLHWLGIHQGTLFPDLDGAAAMIAWRYREGVRTRISDLG